MIEYVSSGGVPACLRSAAMPSGLQMVEHGAHDWTFDVEGTVLEDIR